MPWGRVMMPKKTLSASMAKSLSLSDKLLLARRLCLHGWVEQMESLSMNKLVMVMSVLLIIVLIFGADSIVLASTKNPQDAFDYAERSELKQANGEWDGALADINKAIEMEPEYAFTYVIRSKLWQAKGEWDKALADANKAIENCVGVTFTYAEAYALRSEIWQAKGEWDKALADANTAIKNYPNDQYARKVYNDLIKKKQAREEAERLARQEEAERQARLAREKQEKENALTQASLWWLKGELSKAQADFNKGVEYNPQLLKLPLYHLKSPTFLNIGNTRRWVTVQEVFLVNDSTGKILYPYPDVAVDPAKLTEGKRVEVAGECPQKGTLCELKLHIVADLDLDHLLWGEKIPLQSTQIQVEPSLSKVYTFTAEIPLDMASKPFELVLVSRKGRSFKYELQLQGTQLQAKQTAKELADEL